MQTKKQSLIEILVNISTGMIIAYIAAALLSFSSPYIDKYLFSFHFSVDSTSNIFATIYFTVISMVRSYYWRRYFNERHKV